MNIRRRKLFLSLLCVFGLTFLFLGARHPCVHERLVPVNKIPDDLIKTESVGSDPSLPLCSLTPEGKLPEIPFYPDVLQDEDLELFPAKYGIQNGGSSWPSTCRPQISTAILVPYRNRTAQLRAFLWYMHQFLHLQKINYTIYIVEQSEKHPFNHGKLLNAGYREFQALGSRHECIIFQDMDTLPENVLNIYGCSHQPRHMVVALNTFRYHLPYCDLAGGANALTTEQFERVNGFANRFFGWGGEDDEFYVRVLMSGYNLTRWDPLVARYSMMIHKKEKANPERFRLLKDIEGQVKTDGLISLAYKRLEVEEKELYTRFLVEL